LGATNVEVDSVSGLLKKIQTTVDRVNRKRRGVAWSQARAGYAFVAGSMIAFCAFMLVPMVWGAWLSLNNYRLFAPPRFVGLENYRNFLTDISFHTALLNTVYFTVALTLIVIVISISLAVVLNKDFKGRGWFRGAIYLPAIIPTVCASLTWTYIYSGGRAGIFNYLISSFGVPAKNWLHDPDLAMPAVIAVTVWLSVGHYMLVFLTGLQSIPENLYEAAKIDGAGSFQQFRYVTIPLLKPVTLFVVLMLIISSFQVFGQIYVMTDGGPMAKTTTLVYLVYRTAFELVQFGYAAAQGFVLFAILMVLSLITLRLLGGESA
jgi:multiple sugar transport system permease protein